MTPNDVRKHLTEHLGDKTTIRGIVAMCNWAVHRIHKYRKWSYYETKTQIALVDAYETGTVSVSDGTALVTGSGTTFTSDMVGRQIRISPSSGSSPTGPFDIDSFTSTVAISLDANWVGDNESSLTYSIYQDTFSLPSDCNEILAVYDYAIRRELAAEPQRERGRYQAWRDSLSNFWTRTYSTYGRDSSGNHKIQFNPSPNAKSRIGILYYRHPTPASTVNSTIDVDSQLDEVVKQLVLARVRQQMNADNWREEMTLANDMMSDAWLWDQPTRALVQLRRADGFNDIESIFLNVPAQSGISAGVTVIDV